MTAAGGGPFCARCQRPIQPGQERETLAKFSASGAGAPLVVHKELCARRR